MLHASTIHLSPGRRAKTNLVTRDEDIEEKKEDVVYTRRRDVDADEEETKSSSAMPTINPHRNPDNTAALVKSDQGVQQARQGLMQVLMEHRFHTTFSSTPLGMDTSQNSVRNSSNGSIHYHHQQPQQRHHSRADSGLLSDGGSTSLSDNDDRSSSITEQERLYLEQLILEGDVATMEAAKARLQDPTLFPKLEASRETSLETTATTAAPTGATSKPPMDPTTSVKRRDSKVQQKLFQIHQEKAVQPSKVLQFIQQSKNQNSILNSTEDVAADETPPTSTEAATPNTNNRIKSRFQSTAIDDSINQSNNSLRRQMRVQNSMTLDANDDEAATTMATTTAPTATAGGTMTTSPNKLRERFQSTAMGDSFNQSNNSMRRSTRLSGMVVADDDASWDPMSGPSSLDEQDNNGHVQELIEEEEMNEPKTQDEQNPTNDGNKVAALENGTVPKDASSDQFEEPDPFKDIASWIDGGQGVEVNDSGIPLLGSQKSSSSHLDGKQGNSPTDAQEDTSADQASSDEEQYPHHRNFRILGTSAEDISCHPHVLSPPLMESLLSFAPEPVMESSNFWLKYSLVRDGANLWTMLRQIRASNPTVLAIETVDGHVFGAFTDNAWRFSVGWYGGSSQSFLWKMRHSRLETSRSIVEQAVHESEIQVFPVRPGNVAVQYCSKERLMLGNGEISNVGNKRKPNTPVATATPAGVATAAKVSTPPRNTKATTPPRSTKSSHPHTPVRGSSDDNAGGGKHYGHGIYLESSLLRGSTSSSETFGNPCLVDEQQRGVKFDVANIEVWTLTPHDNVSEAQQSELSTLFLEGGKQEKDLNLLDILVGGAI
mmetsp:Transcript_10198/g.28078  ORF Transcript_10198/g.28078 Transcript_10198/m.28078 type:complete len:829 (+) Transcript_10198:263-2749(+)|eukprot:CAMPEP_0168778652 /NCGR_PEP_ID=MMETSP0725-20121227/7192_1 /TAXON_ID=265536 /ORGANISM="Amphiprora sp., Strain CCMP467" /LENGTH=828 /DNA_ID=CAMNT_0008828427 /DNA_START=263 /DNA_END=2749 /DNA_ORIENTATION=-